MIDEISMIGTRHGLRVAARVYRPAGAGRYPTLFAASPYRFDNDEVEPTALFPWQETGPIGWYVSHGYAFVHVDVVGSGRSEGEYGFLDSREQEANVDAIEWVARQPWSDGKVGGYGQSYYCMSQWLYAIHRPPHLTCLGAYDGLVDPYFYFAFSGGIESFYLPFWNMVALAPSNMWPRNGRHPRAISSRYMDEALAHPTFDDYWRERSARDRLDRIGIPVFSIGVFAKHELHCSGNIRGFLHTKGERKLFLTGTPSVASAHADFAGVDFHAAHLKPFYDRHLKGEASSYDDRPPVAYAIRNSPVTAAAETWPPADVVERTFHLHGADDGDARSRNGVLSAESAGEGRLAYSYPDPSWSLGLGASTMTPAGLDHTGSLLSFVAEPLAQGFDLVGKSRLLLHASSTCEDLDLIVKLVDLGPLDLPHAAPVIVTRGWLRASFRKRLDADDPYSARDFSTRLLVAPGTIVEIEVPLEQMAYRFADRTRLALLVCNHDSPVLDRQFAHIFRASKVGEDTFHFGAAHPSRLVLQTRQAGAGA